jgi:beta-carotene 3-hydroxylase
MTAFLHISIVIGTFIFMEAVAWFTHKYVMHGIGWFLHDDHHVPSKKSFFEKNDFFFLIFAIPGMTFIGLGTFMGYNILLMVGIGITIYGAAYFFVHDLFIHQRIKVLRQTKNPYLRAIRKAHKVHHKHLTKENGECFGMLWVPLKYYKEARSASV